MAHPPEALDSERVKERHRRVDKPTRSLERTHLQRELSVRAFDLRVGRLAGDAEELIELAARIPACRETSVEECEKRATSVRPTIKGRPRYQPESNIKERRRGGRVRRISYGTDVHSTIDAPFVVGIENPFAAENEERIRWLLLFFSLLAVSGSASGLRHRADREETDWCVPLKKPGMRWRPDQFEQPAEPRRLALPDGDDCFQGIFRGDQINFSDGVLRIACKKTRGNRMTGR